MELLLSTTKLVSAQSAMLNFGDTENEGIPIVSIALQLVDQHVGKAGRNESPAVHDRAAGDEDRTSQFGDRKGAMRRGQAKPHEIRAVRHRDPDNGPLQSIPG